jgi:hypothetical protein
LSTSSSTIALVYFVVNDSRNKGKALTVMTRDYIQLLERTISALERIHENRNRTD